MSLRRCRQNPGLNERHLSNAEVLLQQWMGQALLFPFLICFDDELATRVGVHRAAFALVEMSRADLLAIDEGDGEPIRQPRSELFHEVQCQRWPIRPVNVKKADERIKPHTG